MGAGAVSAIVPPLWSRHRAVGSIGSKARSGVVPGAIAGAVVGGLCEAFIFLFVTWLHQVQGRDQGVRAASVAADVVDPADSGPGRLTNS